MLTSDLSKRYGCLKNGVKDIINHKFFYDFDWKNLLFQNLQPPYIPEIRNGADTSNFNVYPESDNNAPFLKQDKDPFLNW